VVILNKFNVDTLFLEMVRSQFEEMLPFLMIGRDYSWQELLGEDFMADLSGLPKSLASLSLLHISEQPEARLMALSPTGCDTTHFQIR
jgi:hypothetical protein